MEHDNAYLCGNCFHIKFSWIFARGPSMKQNVVSRLTSRVKELSGDAFCLLPISGIIKKDEQNPFEST
jgi:hypothetical protein